MAGAFDFDLPEAAELESDGVVVPSLPDLLGASLVPDLGVVVPEGDSGCVVVAAAPLGVRLCGVAGTDLVFDVSFAPTAVSGFAGSAGFTGSAGFSIAGGAAAEAGAVASPVGATLACAAALGTAGTGGGGSTFSAMDGAASAAGGGSDLRVNAKMAPANPAMTISMMTARMPPPELALRTGKPASSSSLSVSAAGTASATTLRV